jgi:hypothetical protein
MYSVFISTNGEHWVQQWFGHKVGGAAFVNNTFMLFGYNGIVLQSDPVGALMLNASRPNTGYFEVIARGGEVGRTYRLQSCIDLSTLSWTDLTTFTQTRDPTRIVIPTSPDSRQAYYRAISP